MSHTIAILSGTRWATRLQNHYLIADVGRTPFWTSACTGNTRQTNILPSASRWSRQRWKCPNCRMETLPCSRLGTTENGSHEHPTGGPRCPRETHPIVIGQVRLESLLVLLASTNMDHCLCHRRKLDRRRHSTPSLLVSSRPHWSLPT